MGDRTKIADALDDSAATIRGVGMWQERNGDVMSTLPSIADLMERAAGLLRADPDTSEERSCPECGSTNPQKCGTGNSEHRHAGDYPARPCCQNPFHADPDTSDDHAKGCTSDMPLSMCQCDTPGWVPDTSDELFTEARRLLDAAMSGPLAYDGCFVLDGVTGDVSFECDSEQTAALFAAAPLLIAALLERAVTAEADLRTLSTRTTGDSKTDLRMLYAYEAGVMEGEAERDADVSAGAVARTVAMSHIAAERDAERAARERAEAEARQLREAIGDPKKLRLTAMSVRSVSRSASLHLHRIADAAAVAEGAEDRGQTDG